MKKITLLFLLFFTCFCWQAQAQCGSSAIPYTQDFSSGTFPSCWTRTSTTDVTLEATCGSRSNVLRFDESEQAITGDIDASTSTTGSLEVSYYIADSVCGDDADDGEEFNVDYWDGAQWVTAKTYDASRPDAYTLETFYVAQSSLPKDFKVRFDQIDGTTDSWFIDSLVVKQGPTCLPSSDLMVTNLLTTKADLGWTDNNAATTWDIEVVTAGTAPSGTPTDSGVTTNPYTKTGLTPNTAYEFYVRADCGGGDLSTWTGPFAFTTLCLKGTLPYTEGFSSGTFPSCWSRSSTTDVVIEATCGTRSNVLRFDESEQAITGSIDASTSATGSLEVSYYIAESVCGDAADSGEEFNVDYWDGTQWVTAKTYDASRTDAYTLETFYVFQSSLPKDFKVRFDQIDGTTDSWFIDDLTVKLGPTCFPPTKLTATTVKVTQAGLGWTEGNTPAATTWDIYVVTAGSAAPTASTAPTDAGITKNPYTKTSLTANTDYEFYVRTDCGGGDLSPWAGPYSFTTLCDTYNLPFVETFDDSDTPECWTESGDNSWDYSTSAGYAASDVDDHTSGGGTDYAWMDGSDNGDKDKSTLTSPKVDLSTLTNPALEFYAFSNNTDDAAINILEVEFYDGANWNKVITIDQLLGPDWAYFLLDLSSYTITGDAAVRFSVTGNANGGNAQYNDILIDDVSFLEGPNSKCYPPLYLGASSITANKAKLNWTDNIGATKWDIAVVADGTKPTTPTKSGVTKNPYTVTGLTDNTDYDFYVRADCGNGDTSSWAGPYSFITPCGIKIAPWKDDLEGHPDADDFTESECWTAVNSALTWNVEGEGDANSSNTGPSAAYSGKNYFYVEASSGSEGDIAELITPTVNINALATPALEFYYHMYGGDMGDLHVDVFDGTKWIEDVALIQGEQQTSESDPWLSMKVSLATYTGKVQVRFRGERGAGFESDISLDDISIEELLAGPANIAADSVTQKTAVVTWKELGKEKKWELEYGPVGFTQGKGKIVVDKDGVMDEKISGLTPGTEYDVYVRSIDKDGNPSAWAGPAYFVTVCKEFTTFPFKETFEEKSPNRLCARNDFVSGNTGWEYVEANQNGTITPRKGKLMAEFRSTGRGESAKLILGPFDMSSVSSPQLTFYYANAAWSGEVDELRVYYKTKIDTAWTPLGQNYTTEHTSWTKEILSLPDPSKSYFVAFEGISHYGRGIGVDDVLIGKAPVCAKPSNIVVKPDIVSADISWTAGGNETQWEIEYGPKAFTPGSGTIVIDDDGTPGLSITGLKPDTEYDVYVSAICAMTNISDPLGPETFTTKSLGLKNQVFEGFSYYPNPVNEQLNIKAAYEIEKVAIYNMLGQEVYRIRPHGSTCTLKFDTVQTGIYLMKVTINGIDGVYQIIKE